MRRFWGHENGWPEPRARRNENPSLTYCHIKVLPLSPRLEPNSFTFKQEQFPNLYDQHTKYDSTKMPKVYTTDHSSSVLQTHTWRTLSNSALYLLPSIQPDLQNLDVGCGPGSMTIDFAKHVPRGDVTGVEYVPDPLEGARELAALEGVSNNFRHCSRTSGHTAHRRPSPGIPEDAARG